MKESRTLYKEDQRSSNQYVSPSQSDLNQIIGPSLYYGTLLSTNELPTCPQCTSDGNTLVAKRQTDSEVHNKNKDVSVSMQVFL